MKKTILPFLFILASQLTLQAQSGVKRILLEEFSTAPCGFCPEGDLIATQITDTYPQVIWVTHHAGFGTDAMTVPESSTIASAFTTFAPAACIDRGDYPIPVYTIPPYIGVSRQKWDSIVVAHLNDPPVADILISNSYDAVNRKLDCSVTVSFITAPQPGDLRLNLFLVEDSVTGSGSGYDQTNYFNTTSGHAFYNLGDPIVGYVHHRVIRKIETTAWGMASVIPTNPSAGSSVSHTFTNIDILQGWKEQDMTVVAFVSYYNNDAHLRQVINANEISLLSGTSGIIQADGSKSDVLVYPNPAEDVLNMVIQDKKMGPEEAAISVWDATGRSVISRNTTIDEEGRVMLPVSALTAGVYQVRLKIKNSERRGVFIKR